MSMSIQFSGPAMRRFISRPLLSYEATASCFCHAPLLVLLMSALRAVTTRCPSTGRSDVRSLLYWDAADSTQHAVCHLQHGPVWLWGHHHLPNFLWMLVIAVEPQYQVNKGKRVARWALTIGGSCVAKMAAHRSMMEVFIGSGNSRFPFFQWESHGNGNGQCIIWVREWEWELLCGNGREWEWANVEKFPNPQDSHSSCTY